MRSARRGLVALLALLLPAALVVGCSSSDDGAGPSPAVRAASVGAAAGHPTGVTLPPLPPPAGFAEYADKALEFDFAASRGSDFHSPDESHCDLGNLPPLPGALTPVWALLGDRIQP